MNGAFAPHLLLPFLEAHPATGILHVAYSGGMDSSVLLHSLTQLRDSGELHFRLQAIHVNHGLQPDAVRWESHCRQFCQERKVPLQLLSVNAAAATGESPEESAREARYRALNGQMGEGDQLLTAHHQEDQAETFLLQALRGAGPRGLSAMGAVKVLGQGELLRPLLPYSQHSLREYATREGLSWVEDPTNQELSADRNYIRHRILPQLRARWPAAPSTLSRSARHCAEASTLIDGWGSELMGDTPPGTPLQLLDGEPEVETKVRIRHWLEINGVGVPDEVHLARILREVIGGREDAEPLVHWRDRKGERVEVRRFQCALHLVLGERAEMPSPAVVEWDLQGVLQWPLSGVGLQAAPVVGGGVRRGLLQGGWITVRSRVGGERCRPPGSRQRRTLKNILRERGVPPWERDRIPLLFVGEELVQVVGHFVCAPFAVGEGDGVDGGGKGEETGLLVESIPQKNENGTP